MVVTLEILQEAGIRLPKVVGQNRFNCRRFGNRAGRRTGRSYKSHYGYYHIPYGNCLLCNTQLQPKSCLQGIESDFHDTGRRFGSFRNIHGSFVSFRIPVFLKKFWNRIYGAPHPLQVQRLERLDNRFAQIPFKRPAGISPFIISRYQKKGVFEKWKNDKLLPVQIMPIVSSTMMGVSILTIQRSLSSIAKGDAWISMILGVILGVFFRNFFCIIC